MDRIMPDLLHHTAALAAQGASQLRYLSGVSLAMATAKAAAAAVGSSSWQQLTNCVNRSWENAQAQRHFGNIQQLGSNP